MLQGLLLLKCFLVRNGQFLSSFPAAAGQYTAAVSGSHSLTESVLVFPLLPRWLVRTFHDMLFTSSKRAANMAKGRDFYKQGPNRMYDLRGTMYDFVGRQSLRKPQSYIVNRTSYIPIAL